MTNRFFAWAAACLSVLLASAISGAPAPQEAPSTRSAIDQYCVGCHNDKLKTGGLFLSGLDIARAGEHPEIWEKVVRKLRGRMMPPPGRPRPDERGYDALVASLETSLDGAAAANPDPGRTETFRRLNRTEYHNAIRDLLTLDVDVASLLPKDEEERLKRFLERSLDKEPGLQVTQPHERAEHAQKQRRAGPEEPGSFPGRDPERAQSRATSLESRCQEPDRDRHPEGRARNFARAGRARSRAHW